MRVFVLGPPALREAVAGHEVLEPAPPPLAPLAKPERDAFALTLDRLHEADALLADVTAPSTEAGWVVGWMLARGRLVVLCARRDARAALSPLLAGNPSPWQRLVTYADEDELRARLAAIFTGKT